MNTRWDEKRLPDHSRHDHFCHPAPISVTL